MSILMDQEKLQAMAEELAKGLKTPEDLSQLSNRFWPTAASYSACAK